MHLCLPTSVRPPVPVQALQMRNTRCWISDELQLFELRHCDSERLADPSQTSVKGSLLSASYLFEEITTVWVSGSPDGPVRLSYQLRNQVQIPNLGESLGHLSEVFVSVDLLKLRLSESAWIFFIYLVGPLKNYFLPASHQLPSDPRDSLIILRELQAIRPQRRAVQPELRLGWLPRAGSLPLDLRCHAGSETRREGWTSQMR